MRIRIFRVIIFFALFSFSAFAQNEENNPAQSRVDSIYARIPTLEGQAKLDAYAGIVKSGLFGDFEAQIDFLNEYVEYAHEQKNPKEEGYARMERALAYFNNYHGDDYPFFAEDKVFWNEYEQWYYFTVESARIHVLFERDLYATALNEANMEYASAKEQNSTYGMGVALETMGIAYIKLKRYEESIRCFKDAVGLLKDLENLNPLFDIYWSLCQVLIENKNYTEAENILREWETIMKGIPMEEKSEYKIVWVNYFYIYIYVNVETEHFEQAESALAEAQKLVDELNVDISKFLIKDARLKLLMKQGNYPEAALMLDTLHNQYQLERHDMMYYLGKKAEIASHLGDYQTSTAAYKELYHYSDSIQQVAMAARFDELHTIYEVDKHILEKERNRNYMLFALAGCLLLGTILIGWMFYSRRLRLKNLGLVRQILEQDRVAAEKEQQEDELRNYRSLLKEQNSHHPEIDKTEDKLLEQLKVLMKDSKNFTDPTLNRKILAERLHTNENYLWETIKKHYGNTIGEYVTGLRLNYARELLIQQSDKYTIEAASIDAGFGTRRTFERLFRKKYGLSPEEYRKLLTEK